MPPTATTYVQVTGWLCVTILQLLLYRAFVGKTLRAFPLFYCYVAPIWLTTVIGLSVRWPSPTSYRAYWWVVECISMLAGIGVTWEIHKRILTPYPGVRRLAGMALSTI